MLTQEQQKQGAELMKTLVEKAWESAEFKEQLIKNPQDTIKSISGINSQERIIVEDQSDSSMIYLNIPRKGELNDFELTDEQLEMTAGGESVCIIALGIGFMAGVAFMGVCAAVAAVK
jgi:hypothetical protein